MAHERPGTRLSRFASISARVKSTRADGLTLAELLVALLVLGVLLSLALPPFAAAADRAAVRSAVSELASTFAAARQLAIHQRTAVAVEIDTTAGAVRARAGGAVVLERGIRTAYSVRLSTTRDSMAYDARGLGIGAANLSVVARRGRSAETLFVSRLGRVRH